MTWEQHIRSGIEAVSRQDDAAAEKHFKTALHYAKKNFAAGDNRLPLTLSMLGHFYFARQDFETANPLLLQSLRAQDVADFGGQCAILDLFVLSEIQKSLGNKVAACRLYRDTLDRLVSSDIGSEPEVERAKNHFLKLFDKTHAQLTESERQALLNPQPLESEDVPPTAATTNGAIPAANEAVEATVTTAGDPRGGISGSHSVGDVWQHQFNTGLAALSEDEDERDSIVAAYLNLESAFRLAKTLFTPTDVRLIATMKGLADASAKLRMYEQAVALYKSAIDIAGTSPVDPAATVRALRLGLALLHADFDQFKHAKAIIEAEAFEEQTNKACSELYARLTKAKEKIRIYDAVQDVVDQAQRCEQEGDHERACRLTNTALSQLRQGFAPDHPEQARVLRYRARLLRVTGNIEQAEELTQRAERIEKSNDANHNDWFKRTEELPKPQLEGVAV